MPNRIFKIIEEESLLTYTLKKSKIMAAEQRGDKKEKENGSLQGIFISNTIKLRNNYLILYQRWGFSISY